MSEQLQQSPVGITNPSNHFADYHPHPPTANVSPATPASTPAPAAVPEENPESPQDGTPRKEKRHRNKPSLSCTTCTVKKTKCDRNRPECFACQKRKTECHYSQVADLIEHSNHSPISEHPRKRPKARKGDKTTDLLASPSPQRVQHEAIRPESNDATLPSRQITFPVITSDEYRPTDRTPSRSSTGSAPTLLSNIPFSHPTVSNLFKVEHPFSNYWTHQGGLTEVIAVMPSKEQSDILVAKYFDAVDPVYPIVHQETFQKDYEDFWLLQTVDRKHSDGSLVALVFVMLAMGTQFVAIPSPDEKEQTAEFYISASHQALRVINYLGRPSLRTMQTMILIIYFLMNDNHASDAWAFAGILTRHAYALGLNRDPSVITRNAHPFEVQQRRKLWQAVLFQDTFFSIILKLPPNALHSDCRLEDLAPEIHPSLTLDGASDISYISSMWKLANIVQSSVCVPRSLDIPIAANATQRATLITQFERIYAALPSPFRTFNDAAICDLASCSKRLARQALFLTSNYYHCLMLIYADEHENLELDVYGTLDAAHKAISSFFLLHKLFEDEARVWYHFQHRAFSEALVIGELVKSRSDMVAVDLKRMRAKDDVIRMIGILGAMGEQDVVARTRVSVLSKYL